MSLQKIQEDFIKSLNEVYEASEAVNIFGLVIENLTGINLKVDRSVNFSPDGCFYQMLTNIEKRLQNNEPIQYILNEAWFYDIPFYVDKNVLIPRPETEELVDWIVKEHQHQQELTVLDVGSGSGCIPIILKRKLPFADIISCDISKAALNVAQKNAHKHKTEITFLNMDFLDESNWSQLPQVDIIVSNPPYIPQHDKASMHQNVLQYEPQEALFVADNEPLIFYTAIANCAKILLKPEGRIYVEIYEGLGNETKQLFEDCAYTTILKMDMQGKNRMLNAFHPVKN